MPSDHLSAEDLADEWDHTGYERENEERTVVCRHPSHASWARPVAPCLSTKAARQLRAALEKAEAEVERLRAALDRVEKLADNAEDVPVHAGGGNLVNRRRMVDRDRLRAALAGDDNSGSDQPEPAETKPAQPCHADVLLEIANGADQ